MTYLGKVDSLIMGRIRVCSSRVGGVSLCRSCFLDAQIASELKIQPASEFEIAAIRIIVISVVNSTSISTDLEVTWVAISLALCDFSSLRFEITAIWLSKVVCCCC